MRKQVTIPKKYAGHYVVTMDEWGSVGKFPVVVYGRNGELIAVHRTESLGLAGEDLLSVLGLGKTPCVREAAGKALDQMGVEIPAWHPASRPARSASPYAPIPLRQSPIP